MAAIIALCGDQNTGKTETLKRLIALIEKKYGCSATGVHKNHHGCKRKSSLRKERVVTFKIGSTKIGITTRGDTVGLLEDDFQDMGEDCGVYVCACICVGLCSSPCVKSALISCILCCNLPIRSCLTGVKINLR